jgi:hypothetical protein
MFHANFDHKDQRAGHVDNLHPFIADVANLQENDNGVQQDDAQNEFVVEKEVFDTVHRSQGF